MCDSYLLSAISCINLQFSGLILTESAHVHLISGRAWSIRAIRTSWPKRRNGKNTTLFVFLWAVFSEMLLRITFKCRQCSWLIRCMFTMSNVHPLITTAFKPTTLMAMRLNVIQQQVVDGIFLRFHGQSWLQCLSAVYGSAYFNCTTMGQMSK